ncbi:isoprenylcysteine carboxylmethyltransferase family protein [Acidobacteriia bacterium AH_259_A11_L15]|nr:isoprenylcysteine carboxylmethyltransferase family protein [Acidobacteriia bacterium AH_259_A11_L15]
MSKKASLGLLLQVTLAFVLMFFGWGWDDLGGFFAHPARAGLLAIALVGLVCMFVWRLDIQVFRRGPRPVGRQRWLLAGLMAFGLFLVWFLPYGDRRDVLTFTGADLLRYVGLALYAGGTVLAFAALRALGKQYSGYVTLQEDHRLVQTGIYGLIRHPIYLRGLLVFLGLPLLFRSWLVVPLFVFGLVFVALRIRQEEKLLAEHFGAEFEAYRRRTWRLLPYLY